MAGYFLMASRDPNTFAARPLPSLKLLTEDEKFNFSRAAGNNENGHALEWTLTSRDVRTQEEFQTQSAEIRYLAIAYA